VHNKYVWCAGRVNDVQFGVCECLCVCGLSVLFRGHIIPYSLLHIHAHAKHSLTGTSKSVKWNLLSKLVHYTFQNKHSNLLDLKSITQWEIYFNFINKFSHRHKGTSVMRKTNPAYNFGWKTTQTDWKLLRQFKIWNSKYGMDLYWKV
jgi:hypothetical protein